MVPTSVSIFAMLSGVSLPNAEEAANNTSDFAKLFAGGDEPIELATLISEELETIEDRQADFEGLMQNPANTETTDKTPTPKAQTDGGFEAGIINKATVSSAALDSAMPSGNPVKVASNGAILPVQMSIVANQQLPITSGVLDRSGGQVSEVKVTDDAAPTPKAPSHHVAHGNYEPNSETEKTVIPIMRLASDFEQPASEKSSERSVGYAALRQPIETPVQSPVRQSTIETIVRGQQQVITPTRDGKASAEAMSAERWQAPRFEPSQAQPESKATATYTYSTAANSQSLPGSVPHPTIPILAASADQLSTIEAAGEMEFVGASKETERLVEAPRLVNATNSAASTGRAISQQMTIAIQNTVSGTTEIQLAPEELGKVRMQISSQDGAVTVVIAAERPETQDIMRRYAETLAQDLRSQGYSSVDLAFDGSGDGRSQDQDSAAHLPQADQEDALELTVLSHWISSDGSVDIRL